MPDFRNNDCVIPVHFKDFCKNFKYRYSLILNAHDIKVYQNYAN